MREIQVDWTDGLHFTAQSSTGYGIELDSPVSSHGEGKGWSPKTLLLVSLAGCTGMDVVSILKKSRQDVTGYHLDVKGWEEAELPKKFERIHVEHVIEGHNLDPKAVERAVRLSHEKYCGVSASLAGSVQIEMSTRIVKAV